MAGTGLPTGGGKPVTLQASPLVQADNGAADMWGTAAAAAGRASNSFMALADEADKANRIKYLTDLDLAARDKRIELYNQHRDDPEGFNAAWRGYADGVLGGVDLRYADFARQKLEENRLSVVDNIYQAKFQKEKRLAGDSVNARVQAAETDMMGLAYRSGGVDSPEFARTAEVARNTLKDAVSAGLISQDNAELQFGRLISKSKGEAIVGMAKRLYDEKGVEGGYREAEAMLSDPKLGLDPRELEGYRGRVAAEMNKWEAFRNTDLTQFKAGAADLKRRLDDGLPVDDASVDSMVQALRSKGGEVEASQLLQSRTRYEMNKATALLPLDQHARVIEDMKTRAVPLADRIIGAESGGRADVTNPNSSATGAGQFIKSTWLSTMKAHFPEAAAGKSDAEILALRTNKDWSRRMVDAYASDNRAFLAGQGAPTDDGAVYLAHFAGPQGAADVLKATPTTPISALLSSDALEANAGMRIGNKPFGEWTASDLRSWAARKVAGAGVDPQTVKDAEAALTRKREMLNNDPLRYATEVGLVPQVQPVDWSRPDAAASSLTERQRSAMVTEQAYKLGAVPVLDRAELDQLKASWQQGSAATRAQIAGTLGRSLDGKHLTATMERVAGADPVFAASAQLYQSAGPEIGLSVIRGQSAIDLDKKILPQDKAIRTAVNDYLGTAAGNMPKARDAIERAAQARYADLSVAANDRAGVLDETRMRQALRDVTGGVVSWGRGTSFFGMAGVPKVIPPKPGMDDAAMDRTMRGLKDEDFAGAVTGSGTPIKVADFLRLGSLHDAGPARYLLEIGGGFARGADGQPFVLDLSGKVQ